MHGVRISHEHASITVTGVPNRPGTAATLFRAVATAGADVGVIAQHPCPTAPGRADISFTVPQPIAPTVVATLHEAGFDRVHLADRVAEVTLAGVGMRTDPAIAAIFSEALAMAGVHLALVSIEGTRISAICEQSQQEAAVHSLCEAFEVSTLTPVALTAPSLRS